VTSDGGAAITERGVYYGTAANPATTGTKITATPAAVGAFTCSLTSLTPGTKYYVVAFATNSVGPAYGTVVEFTTSAITLATLTTTAATAITNTTATSGGTITSNGGGAITTSGVCWGTSPNPTTAGSHTTDGTPTGSFMSSITGLSDGTVYYVRAYATNSAGPAYGTQVQLLTKMVDADNNLYNTVVIGTQIWMAENLKTTKYLNGDLIGTTTPSTLNISGESEPKYQWAYDGNESNVATYGRLYTWYAVTDSRNVCPTGWHVSTDAEWTTLINYLGGESVAGGKLKETGFTHWITPNTGATNETGFTAHPGGYRKDGYDGVYYNGVGYYGYWWSSSTEGFTVDALGMTMGCNNAYVSRINFYKQYGFSVRCLRDN
jgi:uncharacterized protein (TIGR02145 family)